VPRRQVVEHAHLVPRLAQRPDRMAANISPPPCYQIRLFYSILLVSFFRLCPSCHFCHCAKHPVTAVTVVTAA
jgi:hypothetical protein